MKQAKRTRIANRFKTFFPRFISTRNSSVEGTRKFYTFTGKAYSEIGELLHHRRRAGKEGNIEIRVVSGETNLILHIGTYQL